MEKKQPTLPARWRRWWKAQAAAGQCLLCPWIMASVQAMNAIHPEYIIGYCVYGSMGSVDAGFLLANGINFLTIEENMVSPRLIKPLPACGLPVYVWTVDDHKSMRRYLAENVCGLISDIPALAAYAVGEYEGDSPNDFYRWQTNGCGAPAPCSPRARVNTGRGCKTALAETQRRLRIWNASNIWNKNTTGRKARLEKQMADLEIRRERRWRASAGTTRALPRKPQKCPAILRTA